ncbi:MAG: hypothetical protein AAFV07_00950, partial [Bacteroidota bacterium]
PSLFIYRIWRPLTNENSSLEQAQLTLSTPQDIPISFRWQGGVEQAPQTAHTADTKEYKWELSNLRIVSGEIQGLSIRERMPALYLTQHNLMMGDVQGSMQTWEAYGKMMYDLQKGRQTLPKELAEKVKKIAQAYTDPHRVIDTLYRFMQQNIRYESIQLGIGGNQAFPASFVYEKGYGDCKALSNYMGSMLGHVGIPSFYTMVGAGATNPPIMKDFTYDPFNHIILCAIPAPGDTVWLECTSTSAPTGYLGSFTEDRYVLLCTPDGGKLTRTPKTPASFNAAIMDLEVWLEDDGSALIKGDVLMQGELDRRVYTAAQKDQQDFLKSILGEAGTVFIDSLQTHPETVQGIPASRIRFQARATNWASVSGTRIFLKPNPLQSTLKQLPADDDRTQPIVNYVGYVNADTILYHLPEQFSIEALDADKIIHEEIFGNYASDLEILDPKTLRYSRHYQMERTRLPASYYEKVRAFRSKVSKSDRRQVVLSNKS